MFFILEQNQMVAENCSIVLAAFILIYIIAVGHGMPTSIESFETVVPISTSQPIELLPNNPEDLFPNYTKDSNYGCNIVLYMPDIMVKGGDTVVLPIYCKYVYNTFKFIIKLLKIPDQYSKYYTTSSDIYAMKGLPLDDSYSYICYFERIVDISNNNPNNKCELLCKLSVTIADNIPSTKLSNFNVKILMEIIDAQMQYSLYRNNLWPLDGFYILSIYRQNIDNKPYPNYPINNRSFPPLCLPRLYKFFSNIKIYK